MAYKEHIKGVGKVVRIEKGKDKEETIKEFEDAVKKGKVVCLTDALINCGF